MTENLLYYTQPALEWTQALPLGNGRLGAMVFGGVAREEYQLNEETLWTGGPYRPVNPRALAALPKARELVFAGRYEEADRLIEDNMMAVPIREMSYQPAGNLWIATGHEGAVRDYRRDLDIARAVSRVSYEHQGTVYRRESFISAVDQALVVRLTADGPAALDLRIRLTSEQPGSASATADGQIRFGGANRDAEGIEGRLRFAMAVDVEGGTTEPLTGDEMRITGTREVVLRLDIATSFRRFDDISGDPDAALDARRSQRSGRSWDAMLRDHEAAHRALFDRFAVDLGTSPQEGRPTDERIAEFATHEDPALAALYVQYGRYLMICSSRAGTQPSTLQGIWNKETEPPWGSKYTTNINLQMNYWLPDAANLADCFEPLIRLAEDLTVTGAEMAEKHYGARGWVLHHNTDLWRATGPVDGARWGMWPTGGAWLCAQLWDHVTYSGYAPDVVARVYPVLKGAARFILDILVEDPASGELVTNPSASPENEHPHHTTICAGPAMDNQILRDLFDAVADAAGRLGVDRDFAAEVNAARAKLAPDRIGAQGQLQEWREDWDMDAPERHHRHVSHLYGLYPSQQINWEHTPDLVAAARRSLEIRGDNATGWGIGWRLNLWARLRDGDHAHDVLTLLLSPQRSYPNLFDAHPPFQIDGNFGGAAGIIEMLIQSRTGQIHLLPALPKGWPSGRISGVRARGGIVVDLAWNEGRVSEYTLASDKDCTLFVKDGERTAEVRLRAGEPFVWKAPRLKVG